MAKIDAVFFDCDGVLVDSEKIHYEAFQKVLRPFRIEFNYNLYRERYIGFDDRDAFIEIAKDFHQHHILKNLENLIIAKNNALKECVEKGLQTFDGVIDFVEELHEAGIPLAVVSGSLKNEVELFLSKMGIKDLFEFFITANDVSKSKPHPESYQKAFQKMRALVQNRAPDESGAGYVVFEDTPSGIQAAKAVGLFTIAVTHSFPQEALKRADYVISSFKDMSLSRLLDILNKMRGV